MMRILLVSDADDPHIAQLREILGSDLDSVAATSPNFDQKSDLIDVGLVILLVSRPQFLADLQSILEQLKRHPWISPIIAASAALIDSPALKRFAAFPTVSLGNADALATLPVLLRDAEKKFVLTKISTSHQRRTAVRVPHSIVAASPSSGRGKTSAKSHRSSSSPAFRPTYDAWLARNVGYWMGAATALLAVSTLAWIYRDELWSALIKLLPMTKASVAPGLAATIDDKAVSNIPTAGTAIIDAVDCSVFASQNIVPGTTSLLRVSFHRRDQLEALQRKLGRTARASPSQLMAIKICRGDRITVQFDGDDQISADEPVQHVAWRGETETLQFKITCSQHVSVNELHPLVRIWVNERYIGRFVLDFVCGAAPSGAESAGVCRAVQGLEPLFVSYSRRDWLRAKHLAEDFEAVRIRPFIDVLRLRSGEDWERRLLQEIDGCNSFCVIWSHAAKKSDWVKKEYKRAVDRQTDEKDRRPEIIVIPKPSRRRLWERKSVPQPWDFAARFHHSPLEIDLVHIHRD